MRTAALIAALALVAFAPAVRTDDSMDGARPYERRERSMGLGGKRWHQRERERA
jgi:hypothetical protein